VVIGCGRIGSTLADEARRPGVHSHAQAYRAHPRVTLVGVADTDPRRLAAASQRWDVPGAADGLAICERTRPDIVSVCTPDRTHADIVRDLLERDAPPRIVFAEKPLASSSGAARALADLARTRSSRIVVNHSRRFSSAFRALADELEAGVHGPPVLARIVYGKGLRHNGIHAVDLLRLWLDEPTFVRGVRTSWALDGDRTYDATLEFPGGARAHLEGFDERVATVFEGELLAERTRWRFWNAGDDWEFAAADESPIYRGYRSYVPSLRERSDPRFAAPVGRFLAEAVDNIVAVLDGAASPYADADDAIAALRIIETIEASARSE
jgi:predicted dehydrogenase